MVSYYYYSILVVDWRWVTVITINFLLCCYQAVGFSFYPDFLSPLLVVSFCRNFLSFLPLVYCQDFLSLLRWYLSIGILFSFYRSYLSVKNYIASGIHSSQGGFPFLLLSSVIQRDLSINNWFWALSLHRDSDWPSHPAILFP